MVGADEAFFEDEDEDHDQAIVNLYHERAGILDGDPEGDVDLASHAYQIWKNAIGGTRLWRRPWPTCRTSSSPRGGTRPSPNGPRACSSSCVPPTATTPLAYVDREGHSITESQLEILSAAECKPDTPAQPHHESHHGLVAKGVRHVVRERSELAASWDDPPAPASAPTRASRPTPMPSRVSCSTWDALHKAIDDIFRYPLRSSAVDTLNRQLRSGVSDDQLAEIVMSLREEDRLCLTGDAATEVQEPQIICSLGLFDTEDDS